MQGSDIHSGYDLFAQLWKSYEPAEPTEAGTPSDVDFATQACDVALLIVEPGTPLAPNLELAGRDSLASLEAPMTVASLGFPLEGIGPGVMNLNSPTPTVQVAHLTAVTDYFGRETAPVPDRLLVQHAAPCNPRLQRQSDPQRPGRSDCHSQFGHSHRQDGPGGRGLHAGEYLFCTPCRPGPRVDGPDPGRTPSATRKSWETTIEKYFARRKDIDNQLAIDDLRADARTAAQDGGEFDSQIAACFPIEFGGASTATQPAAGLPSTSRWHVPGPGRFLLFALDPARRPCQVSVELMRDRVSVGNLPGMPFDGHPWFSYLTFEAVDQLDDALIRVHSPQPGSAPQVQILQVSRTRRSPDTLRAQLVDHWLAGPSCNDAGYKTVQIVDREQLQIDSQGKSGYRVSVALREPGCYLLTAVTKRGSPIGMSLSEDSAKITSQLATRSWLACPIETKAPRQLTATILGAVTDECEAVLYRASR